MKKKKIKERKTTEERKRQRTETRQKWTTKYRNTYKERNKAQIQELNREGGRQQGKTKREEGRNVERGMDEKIDTQPLGLKLWKY